ncbi:uncharacterized protein LOC131658948 [Vicia villosa]|uniref:uncharacterized protein LOC131658948 n=1 Tax=Vicia villosa TaxID=3911 RepID=UPI00273C2541|nr:uncharacterized protein LOC131658948 [Vicia villosa]
MQRLWFKLQRLKKDIKRFSRDNGNMGIKLQAARTSLHQAQLELINNRQNHILIERIKQLSIDINTIHEHEESRMRQRTKLNWIRQGDDNSKFFFAYLKARQNKSCITFLQQENGEILTEQNDLEKEVLDFYGSLMGDRARRIQHIDISAMREGSQLRLDQQIDLTCQVTIPEIEAALKGIGDYKSPGIDGFNAKIFKKCWPFMQKDIVAAVTEFFRTGVIDGRFNKTVVTLIPKGDNATSIRDYRPIAGCTTFLKIISKILTARLRKVLPSVINVNQAAFVVGQDIHNHIHLAYELLKGYERKTGTPRCMFQIDLQKAYDMVHWDALACIMKEMGIPNTFTNWVMNLVNSVCYVLKLMAGLIFNPRKCKAFYGSVDDENRRRIKAITGFDEGTFPVRYLGVPLSSKKLSVNHYLPLVDKITSRIRHWSAKMLSYAGRVQLVRSVIGSIAQYWMLNFPLPKSVLKQIDIICRTFVWTGKSEASRKSPVAWHKVCSPCKQGGLGLINITIWNQVTLLKCLWNICNKSDSLWIRWIHKVYLKGKDVMEVEAGQNWTWILRKILNCKPLIASIDSDWQHMLTIRKFSMKTVYNRLIDDISVCWHSLLRRNIARPRARITLWMLCHGQLPTKERLYRFGMLDNKICSLCNQVEETVDHLFFECPATKRVWNAVLVWLNIQHLPLPWNLELPWILKNTKGKGWRAMLLKLAVTEAVHEIWLFRNDLIFNSNTYRSNTVEKIVDYIAYRGWDNRKLRLHVASLML